MQLFMELESWLPKLWNTQYYQTVHFKMVRMGEVPGSLMVKIPGLHCGGSRLFWLGTEICKPHSVAKKKAKMLKFLYYDKWNKESPLRERPYTAVHRECNKYKSFSGQFGNIFKIINISLTQNSVLPDLPCRLTYIHNDLCAQLFPFSKSMWNENVPYSQNKYYLSV